MKHGRLLGASFNCFAGFGLVNAALGRFALSVSASTAFLFYARCCLLINQTELSASRKYQSVV